jgi:outer membrane protein TolC
VIYFVPDLAVVVTAGSRLNGKSARACQRAWRPQVWPIALLALGLALPVQAQLKSQAPTKSQAQVKSQAQEWQQAPPLPTDMRDTLATISTDSNLYQLYQQYRANRDGLQKAAQRISLDQAIAMGLANNPTLAATIAEIQASQWSGIAVGREWVPSLSVKTSDPGVLGFSSSTSSLQTKVDGSDLSEKLSFKHGFVSNPYANLSRGSRLAALGAQNNALRNKLSFVSRELILAIQTNYTVLQEALERESDYIQLFNQAIHIYIGAYQAKRPAAEVSRLEAQAVSLLIDRVQAHKRSIQAADGLASLLNLTPGKLALPDAKSKEIGAWPLSRTDSIQQALARREELQANAWEVKALNDSATAIRLKVVPALALSAQVKRISANQQAGSLNGDMNGTLQRTAGFDSFLGLTFDWKIFDGGIRHAEANAVNARAQQSAEQGINTRLTIGRQVADSYATFVASKILVDAARADVKASRLSLAGALADYRAGLHNDAGTTVVQALSKLKSALDTYRTLLSDQNLAVHQLNRFTATWPGNTEQQLRQRFERWLPPAGQVPRPRTRATAQPRSRVAATSSTPVGVDPVPAGADQPTSIAEPASPTPPATPLNGPMPR